MAWIFKAKRIASEAFAALRLCDAAGRDAATLELARRVLAATGGVMTIYLYFRRHTRMRDLQPTSPVRRRSPMRWTLPLTLLLFLPVAALAQPALSFEDQAVVVAGATPGGDVVLWTVYRERIAGVSTRLGRIDERVTADGAGAARLDLGRAVPELSVWAAVDLTTGRAVVATPGSFALTEIDPAGRRIDKALGRLEVDRHGLEVLFVRPGVGSWRLGVYDGGPQDEDGAYDGTLRASLAALLPDSKSGNAPPKFQQGDVLVAVDPTDLHLFLVQISDGSDAQ